MRYQFWQDNINRALSLSPPKEAICILIYAALVDLQTRSDGAAKFSRSWFTRLISAREHYSDGRPYTTLEALEKYAENTYSTLLYLTLQSLPLASITADHIASHVGKAMGITAVLRGLPLLAFPPSPKHHSVNPSSADMPGMQRGRQGSVALPLDVMGRVGVRDEDVLRRGADAPGLKDAVFEVATRASDHLITARQMVTNVRQGKDVGHAFEHEGEDGEHRYNYDSGHENVKGEPHQRSSAAADRQLAEVDGAFGLFMPAVATRLWLDKLQQYDFDVFREELRRRDWKLPWKAYVGHRRREI